MLNRVASFLRSRAVDSRSGVVPLLATYADYLRFSLRLARAPLTLVEDQLGARYYAQLEANGICIVENFWDAGTCAGARAEVERVIEQYPQYVNGNAKADFRVYGANNASALINQFAENPLLRRVATAYNRVPTRAAFTLAAKMPATEGNQGSGEGWHRDAFLRQFKAILYLSDVAPENGPFQMIKDSHRPKYVLRDIRAGGLRYMQYRLSQREVDRILTVDSTRLVTYTAKAGTLILVDTSTIHRGMPIQKGTRYALTNYYFPESGIEPSLYEKFDVLLASATASVQQVGA